MTSPISSPAPTRYAGLDGMRAIAVALVVVYHLFPQSWVRGGFIGVDVFFVISGFLITTLLLREHASTGRIGLLAFWQRRARRLLPALAAVVTVCATAAWLIGGDVLVGVGGQVLGAATFGYNWVSLAGGGGYFAAATPELFRNFWSLAVEEQFYVLWPLVLPLFLLVPRAWGRTLAALALGAASAVWMGVVVSAGTDITRAYFGTDTHAFGILIGIALAFALERVLARTRTDAAGGTAPGLPPGLALAPGWRVVDPKTGAVTLTASRNPGRVRRVTAIAGVLALAGLGVVALLPPSPTTLTFPGAVLAASVLSAIAITASVWPGSAFGPAIDVQPLRWIGDRSYGIYLWHWPLLVLLMAAFAGTGPEAGVPLWLGAVALGLTLAAAELSYRLLETPVRRFGFRGSLVRVGRRLGGTPVARVRALTAVAAGVLLLGGTTAAIADAPEVSSGHAAVLAGMEAVDAARPALTAIPLPSDSTGESADPGQQPPSATPPTAPPASPSPTPSATHPVPSPSPTPVTGAEISAVGDSVMLASAPALYERFPGIHVDAAVSRSTWAGPGVLEQLANAGQLRPYVVIALGTNGPLNADAMERMAQIAGPDRHLILVNAYAPRDWIPGVNADLAAFAAGHPGVIVADWAGAIAPRPDLLAGDQIHPGSAGAQVFAEAVAVAVATAETNRADAQYRADLRTYRRLHHGVVRVTD